MIIRYIIINSNIFVSNNQLNRGLLKILIKQLNPLKTNGEIIKGNYQNFLRFDFIKKCNGKSLAHFDVLQHHGSGGSAPVNQRCD